MRSRAALAFGGLAILALAVGAFIAVRDGSSSGVRSGEPVDPPDVPEQIASIVLDHDPARIPRVSCRYEGIARERFDLYVCRSAIAKLQSMTVRLEHERAGPRYRYLIVRHFQRSPNAMQPNRRGERGECRRGSPNCTYTNRPAPQPS